MEIQHSGNYENKTKRKSRSSKYHVNSATYSNICLVMMSLGITNKVMINQKEQPLLSSNVMHGCMWEVEKAK